jgi:hypothetical protein
MKQHELYFLNEKDAKDALGFIRNAVSHQVSLSDKKLTFQTYNPLTLFQQVQILQHVNTYRPIFNQEGTENGRTAI